MADEQVRAAQKLLNNFGFGPIDEDGAFGPQTNTAYLAYKNSNGGSGMLLAAAAGSQLDAVLGPKSAALASAPKAAPAKPAPAAAPPSVTAKLPMAFLSDNWPWFAGGAAALALGGVVIWAVKR